MAQEHQLADRIADLLQQKYDTLKSSSKPVARSNGIKEWTVFAGIVAINTDTNDLRVISLATGVKALPNKELERSGGKMLHDGHAEIVALRGFNTVILQQIYQLKNGEETDLVIHSKDSEYYSFKSNLKIALYISQLPCGDISMRMLKERDIAPEELAIKDEDSIQYINQDNKTILRGRLNFNKKGYVRTKPGRLDSQLTKSKSCSDKLCMKQYTSILNCLTFQLLEQPVYLDYMIVPGMTTEMKEDIDLCFNKQFERCVGTRHEVCYLSTSKEFKDTRNTSDQEPSAIGAIKVFIGQGNSIEQTILNGVKNGSYTKKNKPLRKNCETLVSRFSQWQIFKEIEPKYSQMSYLDFKQSQHERRKLIDYTRSKMSPDGWISTQEDDCLP
ncbi:tRNA-specific adenosine deaminase NDAI_0I03230 [Naumovozyma dairenensis CBS 421]|uniref:A to I editase domain-containing protein n=1 Tax=Naumovozyma dairenensis (strain ATCC 10597 / BCRC 20456 / CBS 421 / NBRC 0211 / NRRL Y-12639) TaxID=1071378 RepID=G0WGI0_NAUDC|nr:hypothetical protein NDAI_0I03230 [Naumovozyma dairenensis CBS 421]CCD26891.1 hypothetical protein NDAI_0I03230 [Naumovozyma dairenensis CBS 421]